MSTYNCTLMIEDLSMWQNHFWTSIYCLSCSGAIALISYILVVYRNLAYFHHNVKVLIRLLMCSCFCYSTTFIFNSSLYYINFITLDDPCDIFWKTSQCTVIRRVLLTCLVSFTTTCSALLLERSLATIYRESHEKSKPIVGYSLALFSLATGSLLVTFALWNENPDEMVTNCGSYSSAPSVTDRVYEMFSLTIILNVIHLVIFGVLYRFNRQGRKLSESLSTKFTRNENLEVLIGISPLILTGITMILFYDIGITIVRYFRESLSNQEYRAIMQPIYVIPHYALIVMILLLRLLQRARKRQRECLKKIVHHNNSTKADIYFITYKHLW